MGQLEDMSAFVRIVEAGGITRAAQQLGIAKSAVSRRLVDLEGRLGVALLQRTTRRSSLTEAGERYFQRAQAILADVSELNADTADSGMKLTGNLKIAVPHIFGLRHLAPAINEFALNHQGLNFHLDFSDRQVDLIEEGFDLAIRIANLQDTSHIARKIAPIRMILCASPDYLARAGTPKSPQDLKSHAGLHYTLAPTASWTFVTPAGKSVTGSVKTRLSANSGEFLTDAAINGEGLILMPTFIAWQALNAEKLVPVMADHQIQPLTAYALYPQTRHLSRRVRALIDFLVKRFEGKPYWDKGL